MKSRKAGLLMAAVLVALLGTAAIFSYVSRIEAAAASGAEMVDVLVAAERIPAGTTAASAVKGRLVRLSAMPRRSVPEGALAGVDAVNGQTLLSDVFAGEVLLRAKFADQRARTGELLIPKDRIAISVELGDPQRVAGFVVPGSEVAVFATVDGAAAPATESTSAASAGEAYTSLLLQRSQVIAVGPSSLRPQSARKEPEEGDEKPVAKAVLTLAVSEEDATRLVHAAQTGELYVALLGPASKTGSGTGVSNTNLFIVSGSPS